MTAPTHVLIALTGAALMGRFGQINLSAAGLLWLILGSLAPDIDGDGAIARPGRIFRSFLGWRIGWILDALFKALSALVRAMFGHRGFFHSPLLGLILLAFGSTSGYSWLLWFAWGFFWHLVGDYFTPCGIPLLAPFSKRHFSGGNIRTGSAAEKVLMAGLLALTIILGWPLLPVPVKDAHRHLLEWFIK